MEYNARKNLFKVLGLLFLVGITIFAFAKYRPVIIGPHIRTISIEEHHTHNQHMISITGSFNYTAKAYINGRSIDIAKDDSFISRHALAPGNNTLVFTLIDIFEKEKEYTYHVYNTAEKAVIPKTITEAELLLAEETAEEELILINQKEE